MKENRRTKPLEVLYANPGDILCSYPQLPDPDSIYEELEGRASQKHFSLAALAEYLALLETVVLHERIIVGSADVPNDNRDDLKSETFRTFGVGYRIRTASLVPPLRLYPTLKEKGILHEVLAEIPDLFPSTLIDRYVNTPTIASQIRYFETNAIRIDPDRDRCRRIALHLTSYKIGIPLFLIEFASRSSMPLRISDFENELLSGVTYVQRDIEKGVVEHLKNHLNAGALTEIRKLEELGNTTIFPRTPIAGQILLESRTPEDLLRVALSLRREYSGFRQEMSKLEREIFDPDLTLADKLRKRDGLEEMANELWPQKESRRSIFQQVTDELSGVSDIGMSATNPLTFLSVPNAILRITALPWKLIRSQLRRRKVRAMLKSRHSFLNSRFGMKHVAHIFRCPEEIVGPIRFESARMNRNWHHNLLLGTLRNGLPGDDSKVQHAHRKATARKKNAQENCSV